jgi:hypothetical protein
MLTSRSPWLCAILLLAIFARGLIPAGFMPDTGRNGTVQLVICTGEGHATVTVDAGRYGPPQKHHQGGDHKNICPFAPVLAQDATHGAPAFHVPYIMADAGPVPARDDRPDDMALKPWFSRGPPLS